MLRFSADAREMVARAHGLASAFGSSRMDTRHLLVAIAEVPGPSREAMDSVGFSEEIAQCGRDEVRRQGLDPEALATLGIDLEAVRRAAEATFGADALSGAKRHPTGSVRLEPEAKKALELARREAIRLGCSEIGNEALALGILRADCSGRRVIQRCGVDVMTLRSRLDQSARR